MLRKSRVKNSAIRSRNGMRGDNGIIHYARRGEGEKTRRKIAKFLRKHPDMKVEDIAKILGYSAAYVSTVAGKSGLRRQAPRGSGFSILGRVVQGNGVRAIPSAPNLDDEIQQVEQRLQQLRARKASLEIRIEEDGDTITIYGVGEPIFRLRTDWLRWLRRPGLSNCENCAVGLRSKPAKN